MSLTITQRFAVREVCRRLHGYPDKGCFSMDYRYPRVLVPIKDAVAANVQEVRQIAADAKMEVKTARLWRGESTQ